ncbi:hypothetical protein H0H93_008476 [Arthromyces matolae]|nr:hypothetical protein H0H93_008476 [Arthromyces matolae]
MDDIAIMLHALQQMEEEQLQDEDDDNEEAGMVAAVVVLGAEEARRIRAERRHPNRLYLCRPQLLPNPRIATPWQTLYDSRSDRAFITTMGFDVATFEYILASGFATHWNWTAIPRSETTSTSAPRPGRRSLDASGALGLVLHYLNSTMREISLQQIFALIPTTVSRYITFGLKIFLRVLREIPEAAIKYPSGAEEFQELNDLIVVRHARLTGAFASIDGLKLPVQTSADEDIENATYNGWLSEHFVSSVLAFSPKGLIIAAKINAPGSWHDAHVAQTIFEKLRTQTPDGFYMVADTAFPRGTNDIKGRIRAPVKAGQQLRGTEEEIQEQMAFDRELLSYRQTAEWGNRTLQGSFGRLQIPLEIDDAQRRGDVLETTVRAHNLRCNRVGFNQIQSVYMPIWRSNADDEDIWLHFRDIVFGDQRRKDRVSRFHTYADFQ